MQTRGSELGFPAIYNSKSKILILGTYPSPKSFESDFYYAHPQNRFWKMLSAVLSETLPTTVAEKKIFLFSNHVALWDVLQTCTIVGASDASITNPIHNDLTPLLSNSDIRAIFFNGATAYKLFNTHVNISLPVFQMPSTSPANASYSLERLTEAWQPIKEFLK